MPKVSVIVPVYNSEKYLGKCLESILMQSWRDYEVLLINDGSTDRSAEVCDAYQKKDPRVKVWHQRNRGASAARNRGIALACGTYLEFVDSDDVLHPEIIRTLAQGIETEKLDFAICGISYRDGSPANNLLGKHQGIQSIGLLKSALMRNYCNIYFGSPANKMYRTEIAKQCVFPEDICYMEDYIFNLQYFSKSKKFYVSSENLYIYCTHPKSSLSGQKRALQKDYYDMQRVADAHVEWLGQDRENQEKLNEIRLYLAMWTFLRHPYNEYKANLAFIARTLHSPELRQATQNHTKNDWKRAVLCFAIKIGKAWPVGLICVIKGIIK